MEKLKRIIKKWYGRGQDGEWDTFDRFFSLWIALVVAAAKHGVMTGSHHELDSEAILRYCQHDARRSKVIEAIKARDSEMKKLVRKELVTTQGPKRDEKAREALTKLRGHYDGSQPLKHFELVECTVEVLNRVRNNLFHGRKTYDDKYDLKVLEAANPILLEILNRCESWLISPP